MKISCFKSFLPCVQMYIKECIEFLSLTISEINFQSHCFLNFKYSKHDKGKLSYTTWNLPTCLAAIQCLKPKGSPDCSKET